MAKIHILKTTIIKSLSLGIFLLNVHVGCDLQNTPSPELTKLSESWEFWKNLEAKNQGNYSYSNSRSSWTGFWSETSISVHNSEVVKRTYKEGRSQGVVDIEWSEEGSNLGSHEKGLAPQTIDSIYKKCESEILTADGDQFNFYFETDEQNVISHCKKSPKNCSDDCSTGYSITNLKWQ